MRKWSLSLLVAACCVLPLVACGGGTTSQTASPGSTETIPANSRLNTVLNRKKLICGVSGELPGFSYIGTDGQYSGLDVDVCRAIAAALFNDAEAVEFRNLNAKERFAAVQTGEVDILSRNTTWTLQRNTVNRLTFAPVVFYDGQGIMVKQSSGITDLTGLKGKSICTQTGTTNEQNLADQMRKRNLDYTPVVFEDINAAYTAYTQGRCQAVTSDRSQLISRRTALPNPGEHVILEELLSKEPLAPAVTGGDPAWSNVVNWIIYSLINAEELGINSQNITQLASSPDPVVRRFLGVEGDLGKGLGLANDFAVRAVRLVGNYGEIYDRNLGPKTKLNLARGLNKLWNQGGLLYSPPFR